MYKTVFQSSKAALLFAGLTIFGAVSMVGTPEDEGVLNRTAGMFAAQRESIADQAQAYAEVQSVGDAPPSDPDAGWGSSAPVFGEFGSDVPMAGPEMPASASTQSYPTGTVIPGPPPVVAENEGKPRSQRSGPPVIIARELNIQPH